MNVVLGILIMTLNGQITAAHAIDSYPNMQVCKEELHKVADQVVVPDDKKLGVLCVDLTDDLNRLWGRVKT